MADVGTLSIALALLIAAYGALAGVYGALAGRPAWVRSAEHAVYVVCGLVATAVGLLLHALLTRDFTIEYVASYSSSTLPLRYTVAALWGGQKGSLLWWVFLLSVFATVVHVQNRHRNRALMPYVSATLLSVAVFFLALLVFVAEPFERGRAVLEGADLNPLLQNYWMIIHPPSLYTGFISSTVPFAFAVAALVSGQLGDSWIRTTRRWAVFSWFFLSLGNLFGAKWAYEVLGWGGYWGWDPVENAAFMPWLSSTAYLHSVMIQEKKGMLKVWNMSLVLLTFALTIFGTFITRSGVISSVHSFTQSGLGPFFVAFLVVVVGACLALIVYRLPELRSENTLESFVSRESAFLFNNLLLLGIAFAVFWGTVFPLLSEWVRGVKITVGPPFFNRVTAPLGIALLFLTGAGPIIAWRRASPRNLRRAFGPPLGVGALGAVALLVAGVRHAGALLTFAFALFTLTAIFLEFFRGVRARQALMRERAGRAFARLVGKNRRRYGGYIVHVGIAFMFAAVAGSSVFKVERQVTVTEGESFPVGRYRLRYDGLKETDSPHVAVLAAVVTVMRGSEVIDVLHPEKRFYKKPRQPTTEVSIRSTLREDLYVILGTYDPDTKAATLQAYVNPLVAWLWIGGVVLVVGTGVAIYPSAAERVAALAPRRAPAGAATT
jgi:cytochrome c-type biogenesis protein CcmF